jgi:hypothetical protein
MTPLTLLREIREQATLVVRTTGEFGYDEAVASEVALDIGDWGEAQELAEELARAVLALVEVAEAAAAFIATMGRRYSLIAQTEVVSGFTADSSDAAKALDAALSKLSGGDGA